VTSFLIQTDIRNHLLRTLCAADFDRLRGHLVRCSFEQGAVLESPGESVAAVHFPEPGMLSLVAHAVDGTSAEAGIIGPEGMTGLVLLNGVDASPHTILVQVPCRTLLIEAGPFRLARWLLMCHDRADREDLPLTHELLSQLLGVRRAGVTTGLRVLELSGALKTRRGGISIRDRAVLRTIAGASYGVPEAEYARILGGS
jgi:hypothetical protein